MSKPKFWICNTISPTSAEILLYGYIGYDIDEADFVIDLADMCRLYSDIKIRINSGGGSVFSGIAIYNAIRSHIKAGKNIDTQTDGIAASMGAVIFQAGKKRLISKHGRAMTHRARGYASGDADDMRLQADLTESAENTLIDIFSERTGLPKEEIRATFMQKGVDKWMTAQQCIDNKLADELYDADPVTVPDNITEERAVYNIFEACLNKTNNTSMKEIAKSLGLPENATEAEIVNAIGKNKQSEQAAKDQADLINRTRAKTLIDNAIAAKKITEAERAEYDAMALSNYDMTAKVLEKIPGAKKVTDTINNSGKPKTEDGEPVSDFEALLKKGPAAVAAFKLENNSEYRRMWQAHYSAPYPEQEN